MKKQMQMIFFFLLLTGLLLPSNTALSQDVDEYGYASLTMTLELEDALRGKNEVSISRIYRDTYQTHYDRLISNYENQQRHTAAEKSKRQRDIVMRYLNDRVKKAEDNEDYFYNVMFVIRAVLIDGADSVNENPPTEPNPVISNFLPIHENQTKNNATDMLFGHVASGIPESGSTISSSSSQIYHVDAGIPSPSASPAVSQNDTPTLVPTAGSVGNSSRNDVNIYKPLRFKNNGAYDVTVLPASYTPDSSVVAVGMSNASTVVFRDSSPTAYLDLPMGTYTFCYYWDLGTDIDNDGYVDYAHKNTGSVTLSEASPAKVVSAQVVTLNPGNMNNPNGKCGETAPPPSGITLSLTTAELSNQGQHTYSVSGYYGEEFFEPEIESHTFEFTVDGVCVTDEEGEDCLGKKAPNVYSDNETTITFTESGWVSEGYLEFYDGVSYPYKFTGTLIQ